MTGQRSRRARIFSSAICLAAARAGAISRGPSGKSNSEIMSRINKALRLGRPRDELRVATFLYA
jgi:hypothetical protein